MDFKKAFDSIDREALWKILAIYGIPTKIRNCIRSLYTNASCCVLVEGELTTPFEVNTGVRQGCILSPVLFGIVIDFVMRQSKDIETGIGWTNDTYLGDLDFADDICLLNTTVHEMQSKTDELAKAAGKVGLVINVSKTEVLRLSSETTPITLYGEPLAEIDKFKYLGSIISKTADCLVDVHQRLKNAWIAFVKLKMIWKSKIISLKTKLKIYDSNVLAVLTYGSETWKTNKTIQRKLKSFQTKCLRRILLIKWNEFITNNEVLERAGIEDVNTTIKRRRWRYLGHVLRMPKTRLPNQTWYWKPTGKRKRGRPTGSYRSTIRDEAITQGLDLPNLENVAKDRQAWRRLLSALCT